MGMLHIRADDRPISIMGQNLKSFLRINNDMRTKSSLVNLSNILGLTFALGSSVSVQDLKSLKHVVGSWWRSWQMVTGWDETILISDVCYPEKIQPADNTLQFQCTGKYNKDKKIT